MLLMRWSTPAFLVFADTAILTTWSPPPPPSPSRTGAASTRATTWESTVRNFATTCRQFNLKLLAADRQITLLKHDPDWYVADGVQTLEPSLEATSSEWQAFGGAWNGIVDTLRGSDLISDKEYSELCFSIHVDPRHRAVPTEHTRAVRDPYCHLAWGCEAYVVFPPMITAPVFTPELWKYATAQFWRNCCRNSPQLF